jgi:hypothetical protein
MRRALQWPRHGLLQGGKPTQGLRDADKSIELSPTSPWALDTRGKIFGEHIEQKSLSALPGRRTIDRACYPAHFHRANSPIIAGMERTPPRPTFEQLCRGTPWCWVVCEHCMHRTPVAFVPFIIRWGPDASRDMLRRSARRTKCGRNGAALQHPSWAGMHVGFEPFPNS